MKTIEKIDVCYVSPTVEVIDVQVEKGFATSGGDAEADADGFERG